MRFAREDNDESVSFSKTDRRCTRAASVSTEQMRQDFRRERQAHGWEGSYLELEAAYLAGRRRNMKEAERTTESAEKEQNHVI